MGHKDKVVHSQTFRCSELTVRDGFLAVYVGHFQSIRLEIML